jgi:predicted ATPase
MQKDETAAEASFHTAISIARRQDARSWELRATLSLARLWQQQGKTNDARECLAAIYGWFTEGFDTPDLMDARKLLAELE